MQVVFDRLVMRGKMTSDLSYLFMSFCLTHVHLPSYPGVTDEWLARLLSESLCTLDLSDCKQARPRPSLVLLCSLAGNSIVSCRDFSPSLEFRRPDHPFVRSQDGANCAACRAGGSRRLHTDGCQGSSLRDIQGFEDGQDHNT